jgi:hypothetical protein
MKHALISPIEQAYSYNGDQIGVRVAEVCDFPFEVAAPLFWVECGDSTAPDLWYWDGTSCVEIPTPEQTTPISTIPNGGPNVIA